MEAIVPRNNIPENYVNSVEGWIFKKVKWSHLAEKFLNIHLDVLDVLCLFKSTWNGPPAVCSNSDGYKAALSSTSQFIYKVKVDKMLSWLEERL